MKMRFGKRIIRDVYTKHLRLVLIIVINIELLITFLMHSLE